MCAERPEKVRDVTEINLSLQMEMEDDDDSGGERPLYIKEDYDDEDIKKENASMDSTDGNDTRLSDLHNTTVKTEAESEEDKPLVRFGSSALFSEYLYLSTQFLTNLIAKRSLRDRCNRRV